MGVPNREIADRGPGIPDAHRDLASLFDFRLLSATGLAANAIGATFGTQAWACPSRMNHPELWRRRQLPPPIGTAEEPRGSDIRLPVS
jgi:hypothetical protein